MCKSLEYFKTNRPKVDARTDEIAETGRRAETSAGKTTAEQVEEDLEYHKGMRIALFLGYQFQQNSVKNSRPGTHGRVFVGSAVQRSFP